jgi:hypothetical protein
MTIGRISSAVSVIWPLGACLITLFITLAFPPAFWVSFLGAGLLAVVITFNSNRTGEWIVVPLRDSNNVKLTRGEATAGLTAAVLMATPLLVAIGRSLLT